MSYSFSAILKSCTLNSFRPWMKSQWEYDRSRSQSRSSRSRSRSVVTSSRSRSRSSNRSVRTRTSSESSNEGEQPRKSSKYLYFQNGLYYGHTVNIIFSFVEVLLEKCHLFRSSANREPDDNKSGHGKKSQASK